MKNGVRLQLSGVEKVFEGNRTVFDALDIEIPSGDFTAIVGASGCGKSTLLRLVSGLEPVSGGTIAVEPQPETGFVFQDAHLLPWRTVLQNVCLPLELRGFNQDQTMRAREALAQVGMESSEKLFPGQLSGGMKMRVSLARALVTRPTLLLLDEPFAALDELTRLRLEEDLRVLWDRTGMTVLFVTHSFSSAVFLSDKILMISVPRKGIGDKMAVSLGARTTALRGDPAFSNLVLECRRRFEALQGGF